MSHSLETKCVQSIKVMLLNYKVCIVFSSKFSSTYQSIHNHIGDIFTTKHTYSLSKKGTKSFSRYKLQAIYVFKVKIFIFIPKFKITCWDILYVFLCTTYKLHLLIMTTQVQSFHNTSKREMVYIFEWAIHKSEIQENVFPMFPRQQPLLYITPKPNSQGFNQFEKQKKWERNAGLKEDQNLQQCPKLFHSKHSLAIDLYINLWPQVFAISQQSGCQKMQVELQASLKLCIYKVMKVAEKKLYN